MGNPSMGTDAPDDDEDERRRQIRADRMTKMTTLEVTNDPVRDYLNSIGRTRLLTAEEEVVLAKRIEVGVLAGERLAKRPGLTPVERRELQWLADDGKRAFERFIEANL